jgi:hypothetical protein
MKSIPRIAFALTIAAVAAGCANQDQRQEKSVVTSDSESVLSKYAMARRDFLTCGNGVYNDPQFSSIATHIPFNPDFSSLAQLSDQRLATRLEITLLFDFDSAFAKCPSAFLEKMKTIAPAMAVIIADGYTKNEYITIDLIERKLTWGDYANKRKDNYHDAVASLGVEIQRIQRETNQESEGDTAERQNVLNALTRYHQSLQSVGRLRTRSTEPSI